MRRGEVVMSTAFMVLGAYAIIASLQMRYYVDGGPGPGFLPLWLGVVIIICAAFVLARAIMKPAGELVGRFLPDRLSLHRSVGTLAAIGFFAYFVNWLGFTLAMFMVILALTGVVTRTGWKTAIVAAFVGSIGGYYFF